MLYLIISRLLNILRWSSFCHLCFSFVWCLLSFNTVKLINPFRFLLTVFTFEKFLFTPNHEDILSRFLLSFIDLECMGFPGGASGKEPICRCRRPQSCGLDSWVGKTPEEGMAKITTQVERIDICSYPKLSAYYGEDVFPTTLGDNSFLLQFLINCVSKLSLPLLFICRMNKSIQTRGAVMRIASHVPSLIPPPALPQPPVIYFLSL